MKKKFLFYFIIFSGVSKLLGHSKIETTQIYAKIINKKKDDAVSLIDEAFGKLNG